MKQFKFTIPNKSGDGKYMIRTVTSDSKEKAVNFMIMLGEIEECDRRLVSTQYVEEIGIERIK